MIPMPTGAAEAVMTGAREQTVRDAGVRPTGSAGAKAGKAGAMSGKEQLADGLVAVPVGWWRYNGH